MGELFWIHEELASEAQHGVQRLSRAEENRLIAKSAVREWHDKRADRIGAISTATTATTGVEGDMLADKHRPECDNCGSRDGVKYAGGGFGDGCEGLLCRRCRNAEPDPDDELEDPPASPHEFLDDLDRDRTDPEPADVWDQLKAVLGPTEAEQREFEKDCEEMSQWQAEPRPKFQTDVSGSPSETLNTRLLNQVRQARSLLKLD